MPPFRSATSRVTCCRRTSGVLTDWVQQIHPEATSTWIAGYSFGALIGMPIMAAVLAVIAFASTRTSAALGR